MVKTDSIREKSLKYLWMQNRDWVKMSEEGEPIVAEEGKGIRFTDSEGKSWIDLSGGHISVNVGYGRDEIAEAAYEQMLKINYFPNRTTTIPTVKLAQKLSDITPGSLSRSFMTSGGSESTETAMKIVRGYHSRRGENKRYKVISRRGSYHGFSAGVMWMGGPELGVQSKNRRTDFEPAYPGMIHAPGPNPYRCELEGETPSECAIRCAKAIEVLINEHGPSTIAAVIAEPIAGGGVVPGDEYWPMLREICDKYGILLVVDEVITGFGRTGKMFGIEHWKGVIPDVMAVAKGITSSYLPLGAAIATKEVADHFAGEGNAFQHVFTASGHPVAAAAALKNIEIIENEKLVDNAAKVGAYFKDQLEDLKSDHPMIGDVRGKGLYIGVEFVSDRKTKARFPEEAKISERMNAKLRKNGIFFWTDPNFLLIGPPLCITQEEVDEIVHAIDLSFWELEGELGISSNT